MKRRHCTYCGERTRGRACPAHSDLLKLDPVELLRRPHFVLATYYAPLLKPKGAHPLEEAHALLTEGGF